MDVSSNNLPAAAAAYLSASIENLSSEDRREFTLAVLDGYHYRTLPGVASEVLAGIAQSYPAHLVPVAQECIWAF